MLLVSHKPKTDHFQGICATSFVFCSPCLVTKVSVFEVPYGKDWITETSPSIFQISGQPAVLPTCQLDLDSWTCRWFQAWILNRGGHFFKKIKLCMWKDCLVNSSVTYQSKTRPEGLLLCFSFCIHPRTSSKGTLMLDHSTLTGSRKCRPTIYCQISILPAVLAFVASISRPLILQARFAGWS